MFYVVSFILSLYVGLIWSFPLFSHPVSCCVVLILSSLSASLLVLLSIGSSWYTILFILIYLGGIYVLFIFISFVCPNTAYSHSFGVWGFFLVFLVNFFIVCFYDLQVFSYFDYSDLICNDYEGLTYCVLCLVLMIGFLIISLVSSNKGSFYR